MPAPAATIDAGLWLLLQGGSAPAALPYDLVEAAVEWLRANCAASLPGGVHTGLTPPDAARPGTYCQVMEVAETFYRLSGGSKVHDGILQVDVFAGTRAAVKRAGDAVRDSLTDAHLTFDLGRTYYLRPAAPRRLLDETTPGVGGANLFRDITQFRYMITS